jgi:hypothetical protein
MAGASSSAINTALHFTQLSTYGLISRWIHMFPGYMSASGRCSAADRPCHELPTPQEQPVMMTTARIVAALACVGLGACTATPGPIEMQARDASAQCNSGHLEACQQALMLTNMASLERNQRQREADAASQAGMNAGFLILGAILGAR